MYAYVKFANIDVAEKRKKVLVEDIKCFNPNSYDKNQLYKVKHECSYIDAQILFISDNESGLDKLINESYSNSPTSQTKLTFPTSFDEFLKCNDQCTSSEKQMTNTKSMENIHQYNEVSEKSDLRRRSHENIPTDEDGDGSEIKRMRRTVSLYESFDLEVRTLQQPISSTPSKSMDTNLDNRSCRLHEQEIANLKSQLNIIAEDLEKTQHQLYLKSRKLNDKDRMLREQELKLKHYADQLNEKEKELVEIRQLNRQLQQNAISNINQLNATVAVAQKLPEIQSLESIDKSPAIGDLRKNDDMVYIGRGKWLPAMTYAMVTNSVKRSSPGKFVKNMTSVMFSRDVLLKSTVSGQKSNRDKRNNPVDKLDPLTIQAIKDIFRFWLTKTMRYPPEVVESEVDKTKTYISKKIADLKRARNEEQQNINISGRQLYVADQNGTCTTRNDNEECSANPYYYNSRGVPSFNTHIKIENGNTYDSTTHSEETGNVSSYNSHDISVDVDADMDSNGYQKVYVINNTATHNPKRKQNDNNFVEVISNV